LLVALVGIATGRTTPVLPSLFYGIGDIARVESGGDLPAENSGDHAGTSLGAILPGGGEIGGADDDGRRIWAGGAAARWELNFLGPSWAGRKYGIGASLFRDQSLIFSPLTVFGLQLELTSAVSDANLVLLRPQPYW
jgi:hypothetical protein